MRYSTGIVLVDQRDRVLARHGDQKETGNSSEPVDLPASEDDFMTILNLIIEQNLEDPGFKIESLASQLFRAFREYFGASPSEFRKTGL